MRKIVEFSISNQCAFESLFDTQSVDINDKMNKSKDEEELRKFINTLEKGKNKLYTFP